MDPVFLTASELAKAILGKDISAVEALNAHLRQIRRHNPGLNAIVTLNEEEAQRRAREADAALARGQVWGPLHGVPVTFKDAFETSGLRTTAGHRPLARYIPKRDATVVARLRSAGAIVLGKTNLPALGGDYQTDNKVFGRSNNPWDPSRTPGGSTGGGAAAVAAGLSPLEIGSDIGGSIRVPAHFCGVFGLKPTEGRVSGAGHIPPLPGAPLNTRHLISFGPLARSVVDLRAALSIMAGADGLDSNASDVPLDTPQDRPLCERRFAWTDDFGGVPVTPETRSALEILATELRRLGCRVERRNPPDFDFQAAWRTCYEISSFERHASGPLIERLIMIWGTSVMPRKSPIMKGFARGLRMRASSYSMALAVRDRLIDSLERFLQDWDAWLCPAASIPAFKHRSTLAHGRPFRLEGRRVPYEMAAAAYTVPFNLTGSPAVVLPVTQSREGLPIGVQLVGRRWRDMDLLAIADHIAEVTGPFRRPPGY
ncbi:MAG: amidase [Dehalococcoidia bacterium]|nr:amidase [Dehalococcoidia bacterium]